MISQMVEGLAQKLKANGNDLPGWQRLLRSYTVLGQTDKAERALIEARKALAGDGSALSELNAFAKALGLKS
jgi:cytochrome c-type biogenesis protein CcmH